MKKKLEIVSKMCVLELRELGLEVYGLSFCLRYLISVELVCVESESD